MPICRRRKAKKKQAPAAAASRPKAVVLATPPESQPTKGQAALVLPSNAPEMVVVPPSVRTAGVPSGAVTAVAVRPVPSGFQANPQAGVHESGWPLVIKRHDDRDSRAYGPRSGRQHVLDRRKQRDGLPAESPAHQVRLSTYYIDQHEVTNRQFRLFMREAKYRGQPAGKWLTDDKARAEPDTLPVVHVSFHDANAYAGWAGKQLPSEAQWEMATAIDREDAVSPGATESHAR